MRADLLDNKLQEYVKRCGSLNESLKVADAYARSMKEQVARLEDKEIQRRSIDQAIARDLKVRDDERARLQATIKDCEATIASMKSEYSRDSVTRQAVLARCFELGEQNRQLSHELINRTSSGHRQLKDQLADRDRTIRHLERSLRNLPVAQKLRKSSPILVVAAMFGLAIPGLNRTELKAYNKACKELKAAGLGIYGQDDPDASPGGVSASPGSQPTTPQSVSSATADSPSTSQPPLLIRSANRSGGDDQARAQTFAEAIEVLPPVVNSDSAAARDFSPRRRSLSPLVPSKRRSRQLSLGSSPSPRRSSAKKRRTSGSSESSSSAVSQSSSPSVSSSGSSLRRSTRVASANASAIQWVLHEEELTSDLLTLGDPDGSTSASNSTSQTNSATQESVAHVSVSDSPLIDVSAGPGSIAESSSPTDPSNVQVTSSSTSPPVLAEPVIMSDSANDVYDPTRPSISPTASNDAGLSINSSPTEQLSGGVSPAKRAAASALASMTNSVVARALPPGQPPNWSPNNSENEDYAVGSGSGLAESGEDDSGESPPSTNTPPVTSSSNRPASSDELPKSSQVLSSSSTSVVSVSVPATSLATTTALASSTVTSSASQPPVPVVRRPSSKGKMLEKVQKKLSKNPRKVSANAAKSQVVSKKSSRPSANAQSSAKESKSSTKSTKRSSTKTAPYQLDLKTLAARAAASARLDTRESDLMKKLRALPFFRPGSQRCWDRILELTKVQVIYESTPDGERIRPTPLSKAGLRAFAEVYSANHPWRLSLRLLPDSMMFVDDSILTLCPPMEKGRRQQKPSSDIEILSQEWCKYRAVGREDIFIALWERNHWIVESSVILALAEEWHKSTKSPVVVADLNARLAAFKEYIHSRKQRSDLLRIAQKNLCKVIIDHVERVVDGLPAPDLDPVTG
ncbi:hypothetical protein PHYBOEH_003957 [Phytophthora boehmeriae]|uniref:Uncharacterized protein n=1 Tax=Phytophthora boehmeriae TaxID=109152 RepID=A0A8T1WUE9_9STRA|nr:hypothetical protein PHYBOEH_003957 [Phytophthora boehmeriae]